MERILELRGATFQEILKLGYTALYEEVKEISMSQNPRTFSESRDVNNGIEWHRTSQGGAFWSYVYEGYLNEALLCCPDMAHLFVKEGLDNGVYVLKTNGLWS
jgi:hypothetical protein